MILVTGATGNVGRHVLTGLLEAGATVRALSRDPKAARLPNGVDVVQGDLADPRTLGPALTGVDSVFLVWPTLSADHAAPATLGAIAGRARRIVYLSAHGVPDDPAEKAVSILGSHAMIERLIERSGMDWTFLRPGGFAANTLMWAPQIRAGDTVRWIYGAAGRSLIHERDIADVAVRALVQDDHSGAKHVLTGPETLTQVEQVQAIGRAIGRPLRFEEMSPDTARRQLQAQGMPLETADAIVEGHAAMVSAPEPVIPTVEKLIGKPARTYGEWAVDHADDFR
jgi:uncharacterized protein YbjT (DUF2867 family)